MSPKFPRRNRSPSFNSQVLTKGLWPLEISMKRKPASLWESSVPAFWGKCVTNISLSSNFGSTCRARKHVRSCQTERKLSGNNQMHQHNFLRACLSQSKEWPFPSRLDLQFTGMYSTFLASRGAGTASSSRYKKYLIQFTSKNNALGKKKETASTSYYTHKTCEHVLKTKGSKRHL